MAVPGTFLSSEKTPIKDPKVLKSIQKVFKNQLGSKTGEGNLINLPESLGSAIEFDFLDSSSVSYQIENVDFAYLLQENKTRELTIINTNSKQEIKDSRFIFDNCCKISSDVNFELLAEVEKVSCFGKFGSIFNQRSLVVATGCVDECPEQSWQIQDIVNTFDKLKWEGQISGQEEIKSFQSSEKVSQILKTKNFMFLQGTIFGEQFADLLKFVTNLDEAENLPRVENFLQDYGFQYYSRITQRKKRKGKLY